MTVRPTYLLAQITTCIAMLFLVGACKKDTGNGTAKENLPADPENYLPILQVPSPGPVTHALPVPGHLVITGDQTGALRLENANGDLVRPLAGHTAAIAYLGLATPTSGPPLVVSVDEKSNVVVSEIPAGHETDRFKLDFSFKDIDISPDGTHLAATDTSGRRVTLLPLADKTRFSRFQKGERIRWTPTGGHVVIGGTDLSFLETKTWKPRQTLRLGGKPLLEFLFSPDSSIVYTLDAEWRLAAHEVESAKRLFEKTMSHGAPGGLTISASGGMLVLCDSPTSVVVLSSRTGEERVRHESPFPIDPGSLVYSAGHVFAHEAVIRDPDSSLPAVPTAGDDRPSRRWSSSAGESKAVLPPVTTCIAPAPEGGVGGLALGMSDGRIGFWPAGGEPTFFAAHTNRVNALAWHPDGFQIASGGADGKLALWDVLSGESLQVLSENDKPFQAIAFHPDGKRLASNLTGSRPHQHGVRIWNAASGNELQKMVGHRSIVNCLRFSADGTSLVSVGDAARGAILWNAARNFAMRQLPVAANRLAIHPDNTQLAFACTGGRVKLMPLPRANLTTDLRSDSKTDLVDITYTSDASQIIALTADGGIQSWTTDREPVWSDRHPRAGTFRSLHRLATSPTLCTLSVDGGIDFWSEDGEFLGALHVRGKDQYLVQLPSGKLHLQSIKGSGEAEAPLVHFLHMETGAPYPKPEKRLADTQDKAGAEAMLRGVGL